MPCHTILVPRLEYKRGKRHKNSSLTRAPYRENLDSSMCIIWTLQIKIRKTCTGHARQVQTIKETFLLHQSKISVLLNFLVSPSSECFSASSSINSEVNRSPSASSSVKANGHVVLDIGLMSFHDQ